MVMIGTGGKQDNGDIQKPEMLGTIIIGTRDLDNRNRKGRDKEQQHVARYCWKLIIKINIIYDKRVIYLSLNKTF